MKHGVTCFRCMWGVSYAVFLLTLLQAMYSIMLHFLVCATYC